MKRFLTYGTGGSAEWTGKSMAKAHEGRGITHKDFDKVAAHVVATLVECSVPD